MTQALVFDRVSLRRDQTVIIDSLSWSVNNDQRWALLGPNGSGKTTTMKLAAAQLHPSSGTVEILGQSLGATDVRQLRTRIGLVSGAVTRSIRHELTGLDIVVTGKDGALEPWWNFYSPDDYARAEALLAELGVGHLTGRAFAHASEGERQHVMLAGALMASPELLLLDEPFAGLDLGAREALLTRLDTLFDTPSTPPVVLVTHHAEEIPTAITHVGLLRDGAWAANGPIDEVLNSETVSETFGLKVRVDRRNGRWSVAAL